MGRGGHKGIGREEKVKKKNTDMAKRKREETHP